MGRKNRKSKARTAKRQLRSLASETLQGVGGGYDTTKAEYIGDDYNRTTMSKYTIGLEEDSGSIKVDGIADRPIGGGVVGPPPPQPGWTQK